MIFGKMTNKYLAIIIFIIFYCLDYINREKVPLFEIRSNRIENINVINLDYIHSLKKLVYTINLGKYDEIKPINKEIGYDYFLFVDENDEIYNNTNWTIILLPENVKNLNISLIKKQRFIKTHPHLFFPDYNISIYMDSTFEIKGNLDEFLLRILTPNQSIYILEHPERNKISQEFKLVRILKKENKSMIMKVKERYNNTNFTDETGLIESCLMIRKHNDKNCINIMENWFDEIKIYSHRDQLSFNYILWKMKKKIKYLSKKFCFRYLAGNYIHRKIVTFQ